VADIFRRKICTREERPSIRETEDIERPATLLLQHLNDIHVEIINVRALFTVHLDVDKVLIHDFGDVLVVKALASHDVAPVAGRVADGNEDRFVLFPSNLESL